MKTKVSIGLLTGFVWFLVLSMSQVANDTALARLDAPWLPLLVGGLVSAGAVLLLVSWGGRNFGAGVIGGLLVGIAAGLIEGPTGPVIGGGLLEIPRIFAVGLSSVAVWAALGVAVVLTVAPRSLDRAPADTSAKASATV